MTIPEQQKLSSALLMSSLDLLREAVEEGADINAPILSGAPPLVVLAENLVSGYPESFPLLHELIERGADVNQVDETGYTALHWAAGADEVELVRLLLEKGADPLKFDVHGRTPLSQTSPSVSRTELEKASGTEFIPPARASMKM